MAGVGPIAIVLGEADSILLVGAVVAVELGGPTCPVVVAPDAPKGITTGELVRVDANGAWSVPDALTALRQIAGWFEDYNEYHPHSGLRMRSPREFIRAQAQ